MSFVRLSNGEFPPLDKISQQVFKSPKKNAQSFSEKSNKQDNKGKVNGQAVISSKNYVMEELENEQISDSKDFVRCRVGYLHDKYHENLRNVLEENYIGRRRGNFIVVPIEPHRSWYYKEDFNALTDLVLPGEVWHSRVAVKLTIHFNNHFNIEASKHFDKIFRHALYLSAPVIVIDCPDCDFAYVSIASTINDRLGEIRGQPLILFNVNLIDNSVVVQESPEKDDPFNVSFTAPTMNSSTTSSSDFSDQEQISIKRENLIDKDSDLPSGWTSESGGEFGNSSQESGKLRNCSWRNWNSIRSHLFSDSRIGICLTIDDDFTDDDEELQRWMGEPIYMIIIHVDQFTRSPGPQNSLQLNPRCKEFIRKIAISNSLRTSFVIQGRPQQDVAEYLQYLDYMARDIKDKNTDVLLSWNDKIQPPLQPLSSNLDSSTYGVFEMDSMKYIKYRNAMELAIEHLISQEYSAERKFIVMVLGAGRGPLVDSFINAIKSVDTSHKFKIYALDKNPSSVLSLKYKHKYQWVDPTGRYETEVVEADMRCWNPSVKADIIATELLGSLSDNELSPECIDGVWKFATPKTISIPQDYASFIAPICSYKLHQELYKHKGVEQTPFDQIYVVRLTNCYHIGYPQQLFKFEHKNLSLEPKERCNERYTRLVFWSKVDTVCHGFAGYFVANLFKKVTLSTLLDQKTPNMDSWFPAFIPLEHPVQMPKGTKLEVHFWRKESSTSVWYQWVVVSPVRTRIHTQFGTDSVMSKSI